MDRRRWSGKICGWILELIDWFLKIDGCKETFYNVEFNVKL